MSKVLNGLTAAFNRGLEEGVLTFALPWIRAAADKFTDNQKKREWVIGVLMIKGYKESISALATELGYQLLKNELKKKERREDESHDQSI